jgi:hypothetical protein
VDRRLAERKAQEIDWQVELGHGPAAVLRASRRPLSEHHMDFEESLQAMACSPAHVAVLMGRLR